MVSPPPDRSDSDPEEPPGVDRFLRPYVEDPALWPILVILVVTLVMFLAVALLLAVRGRNAFAIAALLILAWMSVDPVVRARRLGTTGRLALVVWALAAAAAAAAVWLGLY